VDGVTQTHQMVFESVNVNTSLDDALFTSHTGSTPDPTTTPKLGAATSAGDRPQVGLDFPEKNCDASPGFDSWADGEHIARRRLA